MTEPIERPGHVFGISSGRGERATHRWLCSCGTEAFQFYKSREAAIVAGNRHVSRAVTKDARDAKASS